MKNVTFLTTNKCNFRCNHCFSSSGIKLSNELIYEEQIEAIHKLKQLGAERIVFSGGEPLLYKDIYNLISIAKMVGLKVSILTNGSVLVEKAIEKLKNLEIDNMAISLYSSDLVGFETKKHANYISTILRNLKTLNQSGIKYKITIPVTNYNEDFIYDILDKIMAMRLKPLKIRFYIVTPVGRCSDNIDLLLEHERWTKIIENIEAITKKEDYKEIYYEVNYSNDKELYEGCMVKEYSKEHAIYTADPHMNANGDLYMCGILLGNPKFVVANIIQDNLEAIIYKIKRHGLNIREYEKDQKKNSNDFCPALNRSLELPNAKGRAVCPFICKKEKRY